MKKMIQKRNGELVPFDSIKILNAIHRASVATEDSMTPADLSYLTQKVCDAVSDVEVPSVEQVQDIVEAMRKMERMEEIYKKLPGYDCGSCGSPTCRTFAEDIVRGFAREMDCIHKMKEQLRLMAQQMVNLAETTRE